MSAAYIFIYLFIYLFVYLITYLFIYCKFEIQLTFTWNIVAWPYSPIAFTKKLKQSVLNTCVDNAEKFIY